MAPLKKLSKAPGYEDPDEISNRLKSNKVAVDPKNLRIPMSAADTDKETPKTASPSVPSLADLNYRDGQENCGNCVHYNMGMSQCGIAKMPVDPGGRCDEFLVMLDTKDGDEFDEDDKVYDGDDYDPNEPDPDEED